MVGREVEGTEVVPLVLDLRALGDREAHAHEDVLEAFPGLGDHVPVAETLAAVQLGQVEPLGLEHRGPLAGLQHRPALGHQAFQLRPYLVQAPAGVLALVGFHRPERTSGLGDHRGLAQQVGVQRPESVEVPGAAHRGGGVGQVLVEVGKHAEKATAPPRAPPRPIPPRTSGSALAAD